MLGWPVPSTADAASSLSRYRYVNYDHYAPASCAQVAAPPSSTHLAAQTSSGAHTERARTWVAELSAGALLVQPSVQACGSVLVAVARVRVLAVLNTQHHASTHRCLKYY